MSDARDEFWDRIESINAGMLGLASDGRFMPMSHYADREAGCLWFITAEGTHIAEALADGPQEATHIVSSDSKGLYADIHGELSLSDDRAKLDELWNAVASSWFEDGRRDDDIRLVRMRLSEAETWITGGSLRFLYEIARSKVTGEKPDMGSNGRISF